ncbi:MAG TPA: folate-binding protein [Sphingomicrobium sp.]|nr:folate-binding protein [Sphingomicrobium sp.]
MPATTLTDRAVVRLAGEDVRGFLQGLVTSDVAGELPVWTGLLTPQGKCLFDFLVWADGEDLLLDCEAEAAEDLVRRMSIYRLRRPIAIERDPSLAVHWSLDRDEGALDPRFPMLGRRWLDAPSDPTDSWLAHRLSLGVCEGRAELGDILWLECNAIELNGVSFTKGCFVGQENTARMNWRQKVNRRLVVVPTTKAGPRTRILYESLGLAVEHCRIDDLGDAIIPPWMDEALPQQP